MTYSIMALYAILLLLVPGIMAQSIGPSNDALPIQQDELVLKYSSGGMNNAVIVAPLTQQIGLGQSQTALNQITLSGTIKPVDPHSEAGIITTTIAYVCCDPNSNNSNISPSEVVEQIANQPPQAILLYSLIDAHCILNGSYNPYFTILTMTSTKDSSMLLSIANTGATQASIQDRAMTTGSAVNNSTSSDSTPMPTTAVAMSILYSITGIITLLFLAIIATGAIRAHRHPERYGPRLAGIPGRPRQSRAKGLARAMLETLPIVKFGDPEPAKPGNRDIELEDGAAVPNPQQETGVIESDASKNAEAKSTPRSGETEDITSVAHEHEHEHEHDHGSGLGPDTQNTNKEDASSTSNLGCSICTEDFEKGEDVRVLPCNHKYHPACIDPWLLNVSGTCPLCRVDLRGNATEAPVEGADEPLSPPLNDPETAAIASTSASASTIPSAHLSRLANAPASERIAALRDLRAQQPTSSETDTADQSRRARLTNRLKERFRIRTHPVSEVRDGISATRRRSSAMPDLFGPGSSTLPAPIYAPDARSGSRTS